MVSMARGRVERGSEGEPTFKIIVFYKAGPVAASRLGVRPVLLPQRPPLALRKLPNA